NRTLKWGAYALGTFVLFVGAALVMRAKGIGPFATLLSSGELDNGSRIVVADFSVANSTDTTLGRAIADAVKADLGQVRQISIVPDAEAATTLAEMRRSDQSLALPVAREVATRRGA